MGQEPMHLVDDRGKIDLPDWDEDTPLTVLSQTTLSVDDTQKAVEGIQDHFNDVVVRNDLCYATTNRQASVKEMCRHVELILVIGSRKSSNCNRLREVAEANGVEAHLIDGPDEIDTAWLDRTDNIGVTSGASTPEWLVESVIEALSPEEVITLTSIEEDITFSLPKEI
jgi:4-hydroxy-3-methylbut-2-enyl diphosphate reductase